MEEVLDLQLLVFLVLLAPLILFEFTASYFAKNASEKMDQESDYQEKNLLSLFRPVSKRSISPLAEV